MDRVKLPREVAGSMELVKHMGPVAIMGHIAHYFGKEAMATTHELSIIARYYRDNPYIMASAIINGYEVEETPEDKVRDRINRYLDQVNMYRERGQRSDELHWEGRVDGIRECLFDLGIKIEGVNA